VENTSEATRVVWGGLRAELRGDAIVWADLAGGATIRAVARDGDRWVFLDEGGALFESGSFLGARTPLAAPSPLHDAAGPRRVGSFVGPALFRDRRARVWRVHDGVVRPIALPWPAYVLALRFDTPLRGVVAVDGPHWFFTEDAGATWRPGRAPADCVDDLHDELWGPTRLVAPLPGSDVLRCVASEPAVTRDTSLLRRRLAFDLAARDPAYLPLVEPVVLEAGTLAAFDGTHLRRYDAASWRERDRVATTWPADLHLEGRLPDGLRGRTRGDLALRLRADGGSTRLGPHAVPSTVALRADRTAAGRTVTGLRCDLTWRTIGRDETDLGRPCGHRRAILVGDDAVELDATTPAVIRAWPLAPAAFLAPEAVDRTLYQAPIVWQFGATFDGRWLYALGGDRNGVPVELAWGDAVTPWEAVRLPEGARSIAFASPGLAFAVSPTGHVWRRMAGVGGWTLVSVAASSTQPMEHLAELPCSEAYCQLAEGLVVANPGGPAPEASPIAAPPVAPTPRPGRSYDCTRDARLPVAQRDALAGPTGFAWVDEWPGAAARHRVEWLGVDERGVFTGRGPIAVGLAFAGLSVDLTAVSRAGFVAVGRDDGGVATLFEGTAGRTLPTRAVAVDAWDVWWRVGACDFSSFRASDWWVTSHPRDGSASVRWRTFSTGPRDAPLWLFSRGGVCGVAVERAEEDALTLHDLLPQRVAPRRASRPAFESARPCVATAAPDVTRWRMVASDTNAPLHLGAASLVADYESSGEAVCLRRASVVDRGDRVTHVLAAQVDGALAGVELAGDTAWRVRCDGR
jgi:hypothetical protein